jgi:FMN phosphatase YigB (HAD superfamily)
VPNEQWPRDPGFTAALAPYRDPIWGDRRQEIVFIGADPMNEAAIRASLDACLVEADDFTPDQWRNLPDPFASWALRAA